MQIIKIFFLFIVLSFLLILRQQEQKNTKINPLFENNFLVKAFCGFASPLMSDLYWINSAKVSENNLKRKNIDEFYYADTISVFDPYFLIATRYYATYFARVKDDLPKALKIIQNAKKQNKNEPYLYELEFALVASFKDGWNKKEILQDLYWLLEITKEKTKKKEIIQKIDFIKKYAILSKKH
jgi:hypothetical protein